MLDGRHAMDCQLLNGRTFDMFIDTRELRLYRVTPSVIFWTPGESTIGLSTLFHTIASDLALLDQCRVQYCALPSNLEITQS